jgi:hypothetical protein
MLLKSGTNPFALQKDGAVKIDGEKWEHLTGCVDDVDGKVMQIGKRKFKRIKVEIHEA